MAAAALIIFRTADLGSSKVHSVQGECSRRRVARGQPHGDGAASRLQAPAEQERVLARADRWAHTCSLLAKVQCGGSADGISLNYAGPENLS